MPQETKTGQAVHSVLGALHTKLLTTKFTLMQPVCLSKSQPLANLLPEIAGHHSSFLG